MFNFKESSWEIITVIHIHVNFSMLPCSLNVLLKLLFPQCILQSTTATELPKYKIRRKWTMEKKIKRNSKVWEQALKRDYENGLLPSWSLLKAAYLPCSLYVYIPQSACTETLCLWNSLEKVNIFLMKATFYLVSAMHILFHTWLLFTHLWPWPGTKNYICTLFCEADCLDQEFEKPFDTTLGVQFEIFCTFSWLCWRNLLKI